MTDFFLFARSILINIFFSPRFSLNARNFTSGPVWFKTEQGGGLGIVV